jgi:two-component system sensor histidine kinase DesK
VLLVNIVLVGPIGAFVLDPRMRTIIATTWEFPNGPLPDAIERQTHHPILFTSAHTLVAILLGIVFLMTTKPSLAASLLAGYSVSPQASRSGWQSFDYHNGLRLMEPRQRPIRSSKQPYGRGDGRMRAATSELSREGEWRDEMDISRAQDTSGKGSGIDRPVGTLSSDEGIASSGVTFQLWRLYQHAWLVCLFFPLVSLVQEPSPWWRLVLGLCALLLFAVGYTWLMWPHPASRGARGRARSRLSFLLFGALAALVLVLSLLYGPAWLWLFIGVSAIAGLLFPMRAAFAVIVLFALLPLIITIGMEGGIAGVDWWWLIALMLLVRGLGLDMIGVARMGSAIRELQAARRELARLAVIEERERLSRDLHDLLGQTLSMIALKSELARQLVTEEPARCSQEIAEIERVARQTLREVREAVAGYRQPTLSSELEGACQVLSAAGIAGEIDSMQEVLPAAIDAVFAWTVREGVTNVIRHSHAQRCHIRLLQQNGQVCAEVLSEGGRREQAERTARPGLGLAGLRERVSALGGRMDAGSLTLQGREHFRLRVELPIEPGREFLAVREEHA